MTSAADSPGRAAADAPSALPYLALGDSYTIGEAVAERERWPVQLVRTLQGEGVPVGEPAIVAVTGWTTDELDAGIDAAVAEGRVGGSYRLVTLLIGVNNQYRGRSLEEYRAQFRALLSRAVGFAGGDAARVVVLSIPDWGVTPFAAGQDQAAIGAAIDRFNAVGREETERAGAAWVDITPLSRAHPEEVAPDGLHPSGAQYTRWATAATSAARAALGVE